MVGYRIAKGIKTLGIIIAIAGALLGLTVSFIEIEKAVYGHETVFMWSVYLPYLLQSVIGGAIVLAIGCTIEAISEIFYRFIKEVIPETLKKISDK